MIDHSGHPHPSTPAARALCRANGGTGDITKRPTATKAPAKKRTSSGSAGGQAPSSAPSAAKAKPPLVQSAAQKPVQKAPPVSKSTQQVKGLPTRVTGATVKAAQRAGIGAALFNTEADQRRAEQRRAEQLARLDRIAARQQESALSAPVATATAKRKADRAKQESMNLLDALNTGVKRKRNLAGGIQAVTELLTTESGKQMVRKTTPPGTKMKNDAEELGSLLGRALGMNTPEVARVKPNEIVMDYVSKAKPGHSFTPDQVKAIMDSDQGKVMGLYDAVFANDDRHDGNWMIADGTGNLVPIDHGNLFSYNDDVDPQGRALGQLTVQWEKPDGPPLGHVLGDFSSFMTRTVQDRSMRPDGKPVVYREWVDNDISPQDVDTVRDRLASLRPEFERLGRLDWYDKADRKLVALRPYAKGSKVRIK